MFDIGFSELMLVMVIGLVVLGPERLPVAVKSVSKWIRTLRTLAASVQNELTQEMKLQELQESLKKVEKAGLETLSPELKSSMDELKEAAESLKKSYTKEIDTVSSALKADEVIETVKDKFGDDLNAVTEQVKTSTDEMKKVIEEVKEQVPTQTELDLMTSESIVTTEQPNQLSEKK